MYHTLFNFSEKEQNKIDNILAGNFASYKIIDFKDRQLIKIKQAGEHDGKLMLYMEPFEKEFYVDFFHDWQDRVSPLVKIDKDKFLNQKEFIVKTKAMSTGYNFERTLECKIKCKLYKKIDESKMWKDIDKKPVKLNDMVIFVESDYCHSWLSKGKVVKISKCQLDVEDKYGKISKVRKDVYRI